MASSGLIVAFVVALWAAYFVPLVLRRYDEANKNSALDTEGPMRRVVTSNNSAEDEIDNDPPAPSPRQAAPSGPAMSRETARIAARRRRNTLLTLVTLLVVVGAAAGLGYLPLWSIAAPVALIVCWLVACRLMVRQELGIAAPRGQAPKQAKEPKQSRPAPPRPKREKPRRETSRWAAFKNAAASAAPASKTRQEAPRSADDEETVIVNVEDIDPERKHVMENEPLADSALDEQLQIAVPSLGEGQMLWDPLPVTLPTYVTKPRAGRTVRTIDFTQPGTWTSGHVEGENVDFPARPGDDENPDTSRRAVGH